MVDEDELPEQVVVFRGSSKTTEDRGLLFPLHPEAPLTLAWSLFLFWPPDPIELLESVFVKCRLNFRLSVLFLKSSTSVEPLMRFRRPRPVMPLRPPAPLLEVVELPPVDPGPL